MPLSAVGIANRALQILGASPILDFTENSKNGRALALSYEPVRDAELHRRKWRFSIKRASLPALTAAPEGSDFVRQFQMPADCLRVLNVGEGFPGADLSDYRTSSTAEFSVENGKILTNYGAPLFVRYIARIEDTALFNASFAEALAARLAYENCEQITQSDSKGQKAMQAYRMALREATRANALEAAPEFPGDDSWVLCRS